MRYTLVRWFAIVVALVIIVAMAVMTIGTSARAESDIDLASMSEKQLRILIREATLELQKYCPKATENAVLYEDENITLTFTGNMLMDDTMLYIGVIAENKTDHDLAIVFDDVSCNGWGTSFNTILVPEYKNAKTYIEFFGLIESADIASVKEVHDIECDLYYVDSDTWNTVGQHEGKITWLFNRDEN